MYFLPSAASDRVGGWCHHAMWRDAILASGVVQNGAIDWQRPSPH